MTVFNDLIEELQQENLLDENNIYSNTKPKYFKGDRLIQYDNFQNSSNDFEADLLELDFEEEEENYPPPQEIVDNSIVEPPYYPYYSVSSVREANKSIKFKTTNTLKKHHKYCTNCAREIPVFSVICHFCKTRVFRDLYYYPLIVFSLLAIIFLTFYILYLKEIK